MFQLCRSRRIGYKKLPCNFTERSQGGFLQVGSIVVHLNKKRASEGNSLSEYSNYLVYVILQHILCIREHHVSEFDVACQVTNTSDT